MKGEMKGVVRDPEWLPRKRWIPARATLGREIEVCIRNIT